MNSGPPIWKPNGLDLATILGRWVLGAAFLYLGLNKALHPVDFLKLLRQYELLQSPLALNVLASVLPWFEVFCGLLLLLGVAVRGAAVILLVMLGLFTGVVLQRAEAMHTMLSIPFCAVKFDCGCGTGEVLICRKLIENGLLMLLSGCQLMGYGRQFCIRYSFQWKTRDPQPLAGKPEPDRII
ncbi:MAG: MauE/DoxX family redox-associated membrane protein [Verrucomicrobiia bacterium]|jgi:uncharacterized membrane protein YphA (DoxX/SURF4 family)